MQYPFFSRHFLRKRSSKPAKKKLKLQQLLAKVTLENRHAEIDWGKPKGKEAW
jgi:antitoxin component of MazEF toxin-antitoxin module